MKKILILGASWFQLPVIRRAQELGHHVLAADNRPANPGHRIADSSLVISTVDVDAVMAAARRHRIDGILAYGTDIAAPTAARVAETLGLPGNPVTAVDTLCHKDRYRAHLAQHRFDPPRSCAGDDVEALASAARRLRLPVIVKPIDVSGSKGVEKVVEWGGLAAALATAHAAARSGRVIVEEFIEKRGYQLTGDGFLAGGRLVWRCYLNQHFDPRGRPWYPVGETAPAAFPAPTLARIDDEVQRLIDTTGMRSGALNFDVLVGTDDRIHLLEVGPRCGGNAIPLLVAHATGVDLTGAAIAAALGEPAQLEPMRAPVPHASYNLVDMLHACLTPQQLARELQLTIGPELARRLVLEHVEIAGRGVVPIGRDGPTRVGPFRGEDLQVGWLLLRDPDADTLRQLVDRIDQHLTWEVG